MGQVDLEIAARGPRKIGRANVLLESKVKDYNRFPETLTCQLEILIVFCSNRIKKC